MTTTRFNVSNLNPISILPAGLQSRSYTVVNSGSARVRVMPEPNPQLSFPIDPGNSMRWDPMTPLYAAIETEGQTTVLLISDAGEVLAPRTVDAQIVNEVTVTGAVDAVVTGSVDATLTGPVDATLTGPVIASISGPVSVDEIAAPVTVTGAVDAVVTGAVDATLTGPVTASISGPVTVASVTAPVTVSGSVDATLTGPITAEITGPVDAEITGPVTVGTVINPIEAVNRNNYTYLGMWSTGAPLPDLNVSSYSSIILIPRVLPGAPLPSYMSVSVEWGNNVNFFSLGDVALWDTNTGSGRYIIAVKAQYARFTVSGTTSTSVSFYVYGSGMQLPPGYSNIVGSGLYTGYYGGTIPATVAPGVSAGVPFSFMAGRAQVSFRALGAIGSGIGILQPARLPISLANASWFSSQSVSPDVYTGEVILPNEPMVAAFYSSTAGGHASVPFIITSLM